MAMLAKAGPIRSILLATLGVFAATFITCPIAIARTDDGVASLTWLTGGTWVGTAPGSPLQVRTAYSWSNNHRFIRFFTQFVMPSGTQNKYDGNIYFDPSTQQFVTWYVHEDGKITRASTAVTASGFILTFPDVDEDGHPANDRVEVARQADDRYSWKLFQETKAGWQPELALTFVRQP